MNKSKNKFLIVRIMEDLVFLLEFFQEKILIPLLRFILPSLSLSLASMTTSTNLILNNVFKPENFNFLLFFIFIIGVIVFYFSVFLFDKYLKNNSRTNFYLASISGFFNFLYFLFIILINIFLGYLAGKDDVIIFVTFLLGIICFISQPMVFIYLLQNKINREMTGNSYNKDKNFLTCYISNKVKSNFEDFPNLPAVYKITNIENGKVYIGQTKHLRERLLEHSHNLLRIRHHSFRLQNDYDLGYNFTVEYIKIFDYWDVQELRRIEKHYIDKYDSKNPDFGYNIF